MAFKLNAEGKDTIEKTRLVAGATYEQTKDFFESLYATLILNYLENKPTYIPYFGKLDFKYIGDEIKQGGKEAILSCTFEADYVVKKTVGQIIDGEETEIENLFLRKIKMELDNKI